MKTAVSIPNEPFDAAQRLARRSTEKVTEAMDEALAEIGENNDPLVAPASRRRLEQSEW
jgi:hypothetical protein